MTADLNALAARAEAATGPSEELFAEVWWAVFPRPERIWENEDHEEWTNEYSNWQTRQHRFWTFMEAEAWVDAALTLAPENLRLVCLAEALQDNAAVPWMAKLGNRNLPGGLPACGARTPALALVAASLRSRAAEGEVM